MSSLLWKGVHLETALGSANFAALSVLLMLLTNGLMVLSTWALSVLAQGVVVGGMQPGSWYFSTCI